MRGRTVIETKTVKRLVEPVLGETQGAKPQYIEETIEVETTEEPLGLAFTARWIPENPDHGNLYFNLTYQLLDNLRVGVDYRPNSGDVTPKANLRLWSETKTRPALILGASNDDFGDIDSYGYSGVLAKHLKSFDKLHISGYAGAVYIDDLNSLRGVGGVRASYEDWSSSFMFSGLQEHFSVTRSFPSHSVSFILFDLENPGIGYSWNF